MDLLTTLVGSGCNASIQKNTRCIFEGFITVDCRGISMTVADLVGTPTHVAGAAAELVHRHVAVDPMLPL